MDEINKDITTMDEMIENCRGKICSIKNHAWELSIMLFGGNEGETCSGVKEDPTLNWKIKDMSADLNKIDDCLMRTIRRISRKK